MGSMRYIRSDAPPHLTEEEVQWLVDHYITTLVDLCSAPEIACKPCPRRGS